MADQVADFCLDNAFTINGVDIVNWEDSNVPASHKLTQTGPFMAQFEGTEAPNNLAAALAEGEGAMVSPTGERFVLTGSGQHTMVAIFAPGNGNVVGDGDSAFKASVIATTTNVVQHGGMVSAYHDDAVYFGFDDPSNPTDLKVESGANMSTGWRVAIGTRHLDGRASLSLYDQNGVLAGRTETTSGSTATHGNTRLSILGPLNSKSLRAFEGQFVRLQLFDTYTETADLDALAFQSMTPSLFSIHTVTTGSDFGGAGTLREAMTAANTSGGADLIVFDGVNFLQVSATELPIMDSAAVKIFGGNLVDGKFKVGEVITEFN
ncbi:MAG: hypothetical protein ACKVJU_19955 [Verrucomicrobiales bacterium]